MSPKPRKTDSAVFKPAVRYLKRRDAVLEELIDRIGPCRLTPSKSHFLTLVEAIVWQQLSWKAACAIYGRLLKVLGSRRPGPRHFIEASREKLLGAGLSRQKLGYLIGLAQRFEEGRFPRRIRTLSDRGVAERLMEIGGIGRWTADMFLIFGLNRPDVFPFEDLGLRKAIARHYGIRSSPDRYAVESITDLWRPYRTVGAWYLWSSIDEAPLGRNPDGASR